jgi:hypothetical protein
MDNRQARRVASHVVHFVAKCLKFQRNHRGRGDHGLTPDASIANCGTYKAAAATYKQSLNRTAIGTMAACDRDQGVARQTGWRQ